MINVRQLEKDFNPQINKIFRENNILMPFIKWELKQSSDFEDTNLSYDMVYSGKIEISVRIRNNNYLRFKDFTIRSKSKNNGYTEIDKLKNGLGNIYFYGWLNYESNLIQEWLIVDINKIRDYLDDGKLFKNTDNTEFMAYSINFLQSHGAIIKKSFDN